MFDIINLTKQMTKRDLIYLVIIISLALSLLIFVKISSSQVCLPVEGYLVWPGPWEANWVPMASTSQYYLTKSPIYVSGSNVGIGATGILSYKLQVNGDISGTRLCFGSDCRSYWPGGEWILSDSSLYPISTSTNVAIGTTTADVKLRIENCGATCMIVGGGAGKIDVGTVDPVYTIDGKRYSTYMTGMTGVKEETAGIIKLDHNWSLITLNGQPVFQYLFDFKNQPEGSDLWLFSRVTNLKKNFERMIIILTPSFPANVWYKKDLNNLILYIYTDRFLNNEEISYRFVAPRFDADQWSNYSNSEAQGFIINDE